MNNNYDEETENGLLVAFIHIGIIILTVLNI